MISVVIPTYNRGDRITNSIESVIKQTIEDLEIIVVDDGSTDNTKDVINHIHDSRIRYIYKDNGGASSARNAGIMEARGEYIAFQDSDDCWHPEKLELQMKALLDNNADIVFCKFRRCNYSTEEIYPKLASGLVEYKEILLTPSVSTQTLFGKAAVFKDNLFDEKLPSLEDYDFSVNTFDRYVVFHMSECLVDVFLQEDSLTRNIHKYIVGLERLLEKNKEIFAKYPTIYAERLNAVGTLEYTNNINGAKRFAEAYKYDKKVKYLLKLFLGISGLYRIKYQRKAWSCEED